MSKFKKEDIDSLANKLLIGLTEEENELVRKEFDVIEDNILKVCEIPGIEKVSPMTHALDDINCCLREDIVQESIPIDDLLKNTGGRDGREVEVVKVVN